MRLATSAGEGVNSMLVASIVLAVVAVLLAWPVPVALAKAHWPSRSPGVALAIWSAIALAGGLSMIGSLVTFGLAPFSSSLIRGLAELPPLLFAGPIPATVGLIQIFALSSAALLTAHLLLNLAVTTARTERQRRRHRSLVELLSTPLQGRPGTHIIDSPAPVAYCLPGARTVTVLSEGLVTLLSTSQLEAVIAHERGHLRQQHHIVLVAFESWRSALPWFPIATRAQVAVSTLVEMLADDQSRRTTDDRTLAEAISLVGSAETETIVGRGRLGAGDGGAGVRRRGSGAGQSGVSSRVDRPRTTAHGPRCGGTATAEPGSEFFDTAAEESARIRVENIVRPEPQLSARVDRLLHPEPQLSVPARTVILGTAVVMLAIPTIFLLAS